MLNPIPNARSGDPYSWFWSYTEAGVHYTCATQGGAWITRLRTILGLEPIELWNDDLQNALIQLARQYDAAAPGTGWAPVAAQLTQDLAAHIVSLLSAKFGIFLAYYRPAGKRFDTIGLSPTAILPQWGIPAAPFDPSSWGNHQPGELVCFVPDVDPPPPLSAADTVAAVRDSQQGVRAGRSSPSPFDIIHGANAGLNGLMLAGLGVLFFAGVWFVYKRTTGPNS